MRIRLDPYVIALLATAALGVLLPATGNALTVVKVLSQAAIVALFFLYGSRLSTQEVLRGAAAWPAHLVILSLTFVAFPLLGLAARVLEPTVLSTTVYPAFLLLCLVPSTVQSSVALTSISRGDRALAVVSASLSSLLGVALTPLLAALLLGGEASVGAGSILRIVGLLLVPFALGQVSRPLLGTVMARHEGRLRLFDRGTVLFIVYVGFSSGTNAGVWSAVGWRDIAILVGATATLLAAASVLAWLAGRPFNRARAVAIYFCGTNKSLAAGLPMASVLFTADRFAVMILPLMIYHQLQLIVGSLVATRLSRSA